MIRIFLHQPVDNVINLVILNIIVARITCKTTVLVNFDKQKLSNSKTGEKLTDKYSYLRSFAYHIQSTSSPGPSPPSKWRSEKPLAKAAEILHGSWSILSRDTWWNGFFGGCFQRLAALFVFCNWKPLFKQNEDISSCLREEILKNFGSHFGSLGQGFLRPPFWTRRRPWGWSWPPVVVSLPYCANSNLYF